MHFILSPAKKMRVDTDSFPIEGLPPFLEKTEQLLDALRALSPDEAQSLWGCSTALAEMNLERLHVMDLHRCLTPAILSYEGIQYQYMAPGVMEAKCLRYLQERVRILSGFYGIVRPFDGVTPYRLEMQARLAAAGSSNLYTFWGSLLADTLAGETDTVINLASKEYSRSVLPHLPSSVKAITCVFGELHGDRVLEKGTMCKMARGQMVRWAAENLITEPDGLKQFDCLSYRFSPQRSTDDTFVFLKV